jgi:DNA repair protein RecO (recombination protein O)
MQQRSEAIILRRVAYGEADWIVTFFSREKGRLSGMAKSARSSRKRFAGALEPGAVVDVGFSERRGSPMVRLDEARLVMPMHGMMKSLARIEAVARTLALALAFLQEHEANPAKFDLLRARLLTLCHAEPDPGDAACFELKWLSLSGYAPVIGACASCGGDGDSPGGWRFSFDRGGFVCAGCSIGPGGSRALSDAAARGLLSLAAESLPDDVSHASAALAVLGGYVDHVLGRPLRILSL